MNARLMYNSPIYLVAYAARMCTGTLDKLDSTMEALGQKDRELISKIILKQGQVYDPLNPSHESVLEHAVYTFELTFSRAVLQELSRHRIASPSVESTRWALKRILKDATRENLRVFLTQTGDKDVDEANIEQLWKIAGWAMLDGKPNDVTKYAIPEAFRTRVQFTINARSLRNWMVLRTSNRALWEIRELALEMYDILPDDHKFMFRDRVHREVKRDPVPVGDFAVKLGDSGRFITASEVDLPGDRYIAATEAGFYTGTLGQCLRQKGRTLESWIKKQGSDHLSYRWDGERWVDVDE